MKTTTLCDIYLETANAYLYSLVPNYQRLSRPT